MMILYWTWLLVAKLVGPLVVFLAVPFRHSARNTVYNYILQNNRKDLLKRLWERSPRETDAGWFLDPSKVGHTEAEEGFVKRKPVSRTKFWLTVIFVWQWLDDDSVHDTTDLGHMDTFKEGGSRFGGFISVLFGRWIEKFPSFGEVTFGNAFDLGDHRSYSPYFNALACFLWTCRNTSMNIKYLLVNY